MGLRDERQHQMAETLAFIQRLAADAPALDAPTSRHRLDSDLRRDMQARLQAFRSRQLFLEIERETYYQRAMQRIRAVTEQQA